MIKIHKAFMKILCEDAVMFGIQSLFSSLGYFYFNSLQVINYL